MSTLDTTATTMTPERLIILLVGIVVVLALLALGDVAMSRCPRLFTFIDQRVLRSRRRRRRQTSRPWPLELDDLDPLTFDQTRRLKDRQRSRVKGRW